ncbi:MULTISPECIES: DUF6538 domain-containing protein [unclassified Sphingomonas]|uniref:DUF6538 domain-containing protein n=1 Tax=unclassified Sphingomonas TaxID=196159 RepID=UPI003FA6D4B8
MSHKTSFDQSLSLSDGCENDRPNCRTRVSHRWPSGVWRRGAMFQYRVRVPSDLRQVIGSSHISRSLGTASLTVARRLAKVVAFQIDERFDAARKSGDWTAAPELSECRATESSVSVPTRWWFAS